MLDITKRDQNDPVVPDAAEPTMLTAEQAGRNAFRAGIGFNGCTYPKDDRERRIRWEDGWMDEQERSTSDAQPQTDAHAQARDEVRRILAGEGKAMTWAAKESGISYPTFNAWMNATYTGNNESVLDRARLWLTARKTRQAMRKSMPEAPAFVETATAGAIASVLSHTQHAPDFTAITGVSGIGKTTALEEYRRRSPNVWIITMQPCTTKPRNVMDVIIAAFGITEKLSWNRASDAIVKKMTGSGGLLIVDEAQHLTTLALDQLRSFHDLARIGICLVGNPTIYSRLEGDGRRAEFAQLFSRLGMRLDRKTVPKSDVELISEAWGVTGSEERKLIQQIAGRPGALRTVTKVMRLACMQAAHEERMVISADIAGAYERITNTTITKDPN